LGIRFTSPGTGVIRLAVYNVAGLRVKSLLSGTMSEGEQRIRWDGRDDRGASLQPGLYLVVLERNKRKDILKVLVRPR